MNNEANLILEEAQRILKIYNNILPELLSQSRKVSFDYIEDENYSSVLSTTIKYENLEKESFNIVLENLLIADSKSIIIHTEKSVVLDIRGLFMIQDDNEGFIHFKRYYKEALTSESLDGKLLV